MLAPRGSRPQDGFARSRCGRLSSPRGAPPLPLRNYMRRAALYLPDWIRTRSWRVFARIASDDPDLLLIPNAAFCC